MCHGSGRISDALTAKYGSPFAVETATIRMADSPLCCEVTRSLFETARQYIESFDVYGDKATFEWTRIEHEPCVVHHGEKPERVTIPDFAHLLPEGIRRYTTKGVYDADEAQHLSFTQGSGHGGSHPHMAHEFIQRHRRRPAAASRRGHERELDDDRHLRPSIGDEGGRPRGDPADLISQQRRLVSIVRTLSRIRRGQAVPCEFCRDG